MESRITVRLTEDILRGLRREQQKKNAKLSTVVRTALEHYLQNILLISKARNVDLEETKQVVSG